MLNTDTQLLDTLLVANNSSGQPKVCCGGLGACYFKQLAPPTPESEFRSAQAFKAFS